MPLLHLELKLPPVLTHLQQDGELPVTFIALGQGASQTAAFHLANALEEQEHSRGVLVLPLPAHNEGEPLTQLLCFGGFPSVSEADVRHCASICRLTVEAIEIGSVGCLNEQHLVKLAERLVSRFLGTEGWVKIYDDVFARHSDLFPPPPPSPAAPRWNEEEGDSGGVIDFVEAAKVMASINMRATQDPWSPEGQLGLTIFLEPMVFKRIHPPFAYLQHLSLQQQQSRKDGKKQQQQQQLEDDAPDEEGLCGAGGVFPPGEAVLEMRVVKFLPDLTHLGLIASLPSTVMELTPLEKANARRGFDLESPKDEESMRDFWRLAHSLPLPSYALEYVRVFFKGQGSTSITYPAACLVSQFAHNYSRTTQAYPRLMSTFLQLLTSLPGVIKAFTTAATSFPSSSSSSSSSLMPVGKRLTSPEKLGPGALKTARQLRDEEKAGTGGEEGGEMINLLGGAQAVAAAAAAGGGANITKPPSSSSSSSSSRKAPTTTGKKVVPPQKKKKNSGPLPPPPPSVSSTTSLASSSLARQQQAEDEESTSSKSNNHEEEEDDDLFSDELTGTSTGMSAPSSSSSAAAPAKKPLMPPPLPPSHLAPPSAADMPADKPMKKIAKKKVTASSKTLTQVLGGGGDTAGAAAAAAADPTTTTTTAAADTPIKKKPTVTKKNKQVDGGGEKKVVAKKIKT